ncbi:MAG: TonB-dependent receptor, partial [Kofleriaceae bacterium]
AARRSALVASLGLGGVAALSLLSPPAYAQRVTGAIRGKIVLSGAPQAAAKVTATNLSNGGVVTVAADAAGNYVMPGLAPGQYLIAVSAGGQETIDVVEVSIGQDLTVNLDVASASVKGAERIEVSGQRFENRTSEIATNVSQEQIANLPQNNRNFLNFATLAPGVRVSDTEFNKNVSSGGLEARQTNVFIDGLSLKNNVIDGGIVGQDASRGNPFPQLAVAGFRVLTQNYKAEYEQAGTAIISTVTRSGGNDVHGEFYGSFQNKDLVAIDPFAEKLKQAKPDYGRYQLGGLFSGPIIKDKLFALATYEGNYQNRANQVTIGNPTEDNLARFGKYQGSFTSPFREHLGFGKVTWLPAPEHTVDLSLTIRRETDVRDFGAQTSFETADNVRDNVFTAQLRHQWRADNALVNEANVQFLQSQFNPTAENPNLIGQDFQGALRLGGRETDQDIVQRTIMFRDDVTFPTVDAGGSHQFKVGAKTAFQHYQIDRIQYSNPVFRYKIDGENHLDYEAPFEAQYGFGDPRATSSNVQLGIYAQDDWQINDRLTANLGLRWDIETNPLNNDFKTPDNVRAAATTLAATVADHNGPDYFRVDNYLTDGTQRPIYLGEIQPRLGASYDVFGDQHTVAFAGAGRYYDRTTFNTTVDEVLRLQNGYRTFEFSPDGAMRNGQATIKWDPSYLSKAGLQGLIDSGTAPAPEIFLIENDSKPLHTDQLSFGVRQQLGMFNTSATFTHIRGENGVGFYPANRDSKGNRDFLPVPGFGNIQISADDIQSRYTGVYLTAEKPYTNASQWGATAAYTLAWSKIRGDSFNFDFPTIKATPLTPSNGDERQRLVLSGIVGVPYGFKLSSLVTLGTSVPFNVTDASAGTAPTEFRFRRNAGRANPFIEFKQIDIRILKDFQVAPKHHAALFIEVFNLFNWYNYGGYNGEIPAPDAPANVNFGKPSSIVGPTRAFQFGLTYGF